MFNIKTASHTLTLNLYNILMTTHKVSY